MATETDKTLEKAISTGAAQPAVLLLAKVTGINLNTTADQPIVLSGGTTFLITDIVVTNASAPPVNASDGEWWQGKNRTGNQLAATGQPFAALSTQQTYLNTSAQFTGGANAIAFTQSSDTYPAGIYTMTSPIYFSLLTPEGSPLTCDIYIYGTVLF